MKIARGHFSIGLMIARAVAVAALPAAFVVCGWFTLHVIRSAAPVVAMKEGDRSNFAAIMPQAVIDAAAHHTEELLKALPQKEPLFSPPFAMGNVEYLGISFGNELATARLAIETHPRDVAYLAHYATLLARKHGVDHSAQDGDPLLSKIELDQTLAITTRGEQLDPGNAFFPLLAAQCLARASSRQMRNQAADYHPWTNRYFDGSLHSHNAWKLEINDNSIFQQAIDTTHRAASMTRFDNYASTLRDRNLAQLPNSDSLGNVVLHINTDLNSRVESLWMFDLLTTESAHALDLAVAGYNSHALDVLADTNALVGLVSTENRSAARVTFLAGFYLYSMAGHAAAVLELAGKKEQGRDLRAWMINFSKSAQMVFHASRYSNTQSPLAGIFALYLDGLPIDASPLSRAEYNLADHAALLGLIASLMLTAMLAGACSAVEALIIRDASTPAITVFPKVAEALAMLLAVSLPTIIYIAYVAFFPSGNRAAGLNMRYQTLMTQYLLVTAATTASCLAVAVQIVRRRLAAVGIVLNLSVSLATGAAMFLPAMSLIALASAYLFIPSFNASFAIYLALLQDGLVRLSSTFASSGLAGFIPFVALIWFSDAFVTFYNANDWKPMIAFMAIAVLGTILIGRALPPPRIHAHVRAVGSLFRGIAVMSTLAALAVALVGGIALNHVEASAVRQIRANPVLSEMNPDNDPAVQNLRHDIRQQCTSVVVACQDGQSTAH